jgi:hypothetical protein
VRNSALDGALRLHKAGKAGLSCLALMLVVPAQAQTTSQEVKDFQSRVKQYLSLRKSEAGTSPRPSNSPEKLEEKKQDLATKVKVVRPNAKQGDIFTPTIAIYFRNQISATLKGPDGPKVRASLNNAEPVHGLALHVNEAYPQNIPIQSTPPSLLLNLPTLPQELEYRIVGRALVLHDIGPDVVVDFIPDALPPVGG